MLTKKIVRRRAGKVTPVTFGDIAAVELPAILLQEPNRGPNEPPYYERLYLTPGGKIPRQLGKRPSCRGWSPRITKSLAFADMSDELPAPKGSLYGRRNWLSEFKTGNQLKERLELAQRLMKRG